MRLAGKQPPHRLVVVAVTAGDVAAANHGGLGEVLTENQHLDSKKFFFIEKCSIPFNY